MENYNTQSFVTAVNQISSSIKGKYEDLIGMLQNQKTKIEPFVDPNSNLVKALQRRLQDVPEGDENGQLITQGLIHFRDLYNKVDKDIQVLQQADENEVTADQRVLAQVADDINEIEKNIVTINDELTKILNDPNLKGIVTL